MSCQYGVELVPPSFLAEPPPLSLSRFLSLSPRVALSCFLVITGLQGIGSPDFKQADLNTGMEHTTKQKKGGEGCGEGPERTTLASIVLYIGGGPLLVATPTLLPCKLLLLVNKVAS